MDIGAGLLAFVWTILAAWAAPGLFRISWLPDIADCSEQLPFVSVIIAARNEAEAIGRTLDTLRNNNYVKFEVIAVNDRSDDATGMIMEEKQKGWQALRVIHLAELPDSWLGKNYALYRGAQHARGDWLLFTDGDVEFAPDALARAVSYVEKHKPDHLVVPPEMKLSGWWLRALVAFFIFNLSLFFRPYEAGNPRSHAHMGVGAFNMVRRPVYEAIGTHRALALRPDDDLRLGRMIKEQGFRQHFIPARAFVRVQWYPNVRAMLEGLEKNALTPFRYSVALLIAGMVPLFALYVGPFVLPWIGSGWIRAAGLYCLAVMLGLYALNGKFTQLPLSLFWVLPAVVLLFIYALVRAAFLAVKRGGIYWRGTFYSLEELRRQL